MTLPDLSYLALPQIRYCCRISLLQECCFGTIPGAGMQSHRSAKKNYICCMYEPFAVLSLQIFTTKLSDDFCIAMLDARLLF